MNCFSCSTLDDEVRPRGHVQTILPNSSSRVAPAPILPNTQGNRTVSQFMENHPNFVVYKKAKPYSFPSRDSLTALDALSLKEAEEKFGPAIRAHQEEDRLQEIKIKKLDAVSAQAKREYKALERETHRNWEIMKKAGEDKEMVKMHGQLFGY